MSKYDVKEIEKEGLKRMQELFTTGNAYFLEHATIPSTIGFVLSSNPMALFSWFDHPPHKLIVLLADL